MEVKNLNRAEARGKDDFAYNYKLTNTDLGKTLPEYAEEYIEFMILKGHYKYGDRLIESRIAEKLHISRGPVRDAIKSLEQKGVVTIEPRRGAKVANFKERDFIEILGLRLLLENSIIENLVEEEELSKRDFSILRDMADHMVNIAKSDVADHDKLLELSEHNLAFHKYIWDKSKSKRRKTILYSMLFQLRLAMFYDLQKTADLDKTLNAHYTLLDHMEAGQIEPAKQALKDHIQSLNRG